MTDEGDRGVVEHNVVFIVGLSCGIDGDAMVEVSGGGEVPPRAERRVVWPPYEIPADIEVDGERLEFLRLGDGWQWCPDPAMRLRCPRCRGFITGDFTVEQVCPCGLLRYDRWGEFHRSSTDGIEFWRVVRRPVQAAGDE